MAGKLCAAGTPEEVMEDPNSLTGQYLSGKNSFHFHWNAGNQMVDLWRSKGQKKII